jgi:predicted lysophospholipase L1 biosynthesis ABC-type transport system permease subunit
MPGTVLGQASPAAFNPAYRPVSPSYFHVLRIPVLRGRSFMDSDTLKSLPVAIVNASLARQLFPNGEPVGRTLQLGTGLGSQYADAPRVLVGVVEDVHETSLSAAPGPTVFIPRAQIPDTVTPLMNRVLPMSWVVRTKVPPDQLIGSIRQAVLAVDPQLPAADIQTMTQAMSTAVGRQRFTFVLISIFASLAMMMAAVGIYGVVTFQMRLRERELGIRLALGALPRSLVRTISIQEARPIVAGMLTGAIASMFLVRLIRSLLFETRLADPVSFAASAVVLGIFGYLSCYLPVRRASRMDPLQILREE